MKTIKKFLVVLLVFALVCTSAVFAVSAASGDTVTVDAPYQPSMIETNVTDANATYEIASLEDDNYSEGLAYTLNSDGASYTVSGIGTCTDTDIVIPATYRGLPVTSIKTYAFKDLTGITSVVIPDSVFSIGYGAFQNCTGLVSATLGNKVTSLGTAAFSGCTQLRSVNIPNGVTAIANNTFYNCQALSSIIIPGSVTSIGNSAFNKCSSLVVIMISEGVRSIGTYSFLGCTSLTSITLPSTLTSIGEQAFINARSLKKVEILGAVTSFGYATFSGCTSLSNVYLAEGITHIGDSAFYNCTSLTSVNIPASVVNIGSQAFDECTNVVSYTVAQANANYKSVNGVLYSKDGKVLVQYPIGKTSTSFAIPDGVETVGIAALHKATSLVSITVPSSVKTIGDSAFAGCSSLKSITVAEGNANYKSVDGNLYTKDGKIFIQYAIGKTTPSFVIPDGVEIVSKNAFSNCITLTGITVPDSVREIGRSAFSKCIMLTSVVIGNGVVDIVELAFDSCLSLSMIYYKGTASDWNNITVGGNNLILNYSNRYYYSENHPTDINYVYWHYVDGEIEFWVAHILEEVIDPAKDATCTTSGLTAGSHCGICGVTIVEQQIIPPSDHIAVTDPEVGATCTTPGLTAGSHCDVCGATIVEQQIISPLDHLTVIDPEVGATCNESGLTSGEHCDRCGEILIEQQIIPALGHWFGDDNVCERCGYVNFDVYGECGVGVRWGLYFSTGELVIYGEGAMTNSYAPWFDYNEYITSVTVTDGITDVGAYAFKGLTNLKRATIGNDVTNIRYGAFQGSSIEDITLGNSIVTISGAAFHTCNNLRSITLPGTVTSIANNAFYGCKSLESIVIPGSVVSIGNSAFNACSGLVSVTVCEGVETIGQYAFLGCTSLVNILLPETVSSIGMQAFVNCKSLKEITIPSSLTAISYSTFSGCTALEKIIISEGVKSIGSAVFYNCSSLVSIVIPDSITTMETNVFLNCTSLETVIIGNGLTKIDNHTFYACHSLKNVQFGDKVAAIGNYAFFSCGSLSEINIPGTVKTIGTYAFSKSNSLSKVILSEGVTSLGYGAFANCLGLTEITLPNSLISTGNSVFYGCTALKSANLGSGVKTLGTHSFAGCSELEYVVIPATLTSIPDYMLYNCSNLKAIIYGGTLSQWNSLSKGAHWNTGTGAYALVTTSKGLAYTVNADGRTCTITGIGSCADTDLVIAGNIDGYKITAIKSYAFSGNIKIKSVVIGNEVQSVGTSAFSSCTALQSIEVFDGTMTFGNSAFYGCSSLKSVDLGNGNISFGTHTFVNCTSLESVILPDSVETVSDYMFFNCNNLTSVTLGDNVKLIGVKAFYSCKKLTYIILPGSVTEIAEGAIQNCSLLTEIYYEGSISDWAEVRVSASNTSLDTATLYYYSETEPESDRHLYWHYVDGLPEIWECLHDEVTIVPGKLPTCNEAGLTDGAVCDRCGETVIPQEEIPPLGHLVVIDPAVDATCTESGLTSGEHCDRCGETLVEQQIIPALGHITVIDPAVDATCTESGLTSGEHCDRCGETLVEQQIIPALGHDYVDHICTRCDDIAYSEGLEFTYDAESDSYFVSGIGTCTDTDLWIPPMYSGLAVTAIGENAFYECTFIKNVKLPAGIKSIGAGAFYNCTALTGVDIPTGVTYIGDYAFNYCISLLSINIPEGVESIGAYTFFGCMRLDRVIIPDGVTSIGDAAFIGCINLKYLVIPESVTYIGNSVCFGNLKFNAVYYMGTAAAWEEISIGLYNNAPLTNASRYYYRETQPFDIDYTYWHYVNGVPTVWEAHIHNVQIDHGVAPDCISSGLTEGKHCSTCGTVIVAQQIIPALGHLNEWVVVEESTCTESGTKHLACERCKLIFEIADIDPLGHLMNGNECSRCHGHEYTIKVEYKYENGSTAATAVIKKVWENSEYKIYSPSIEGYKANQTVISGNATSDKSVTVTYSVIESEKITRIISIELGAVEYNTLFADLLLPTTVTAITNKAREISVTVYWDPSSYNPTAFGSQVITGRIVPGYGYILACENLVTASLTVSQNIINNIQDMNLGRLPLGTTYEGLGLPSTAAVTTVSGATYYLPVTWDVYSYDSSVEGNHTINGIVTLLDGFIFADGVSNTATIKFQLSEQMYGTADIVFIIDTTGSMSDEIRNVRNNINAFAERLEAAGVSVRWALLEYRDITCDGVNSTKVIYCGSSEWFIDVASYEAAIASLGVSGGGDREETVIDAIKAATLLESRADAKTFHIIVTDADYKNNNSYGISGMPEMIDELVSKDITASVVTKTSFFDVYRNLTDNTNGILANIDGNFAEELWKLIEVIIDRVVYGNVESISVIRNPEKTVYESGEYFNGYGMIVEAKYENGRTKIVTVYSVMPYRALQTSDTQIEINYRGKVAYVPITVNYTIIPTTGITVSQSNAELEVGQDIQIIASVLPANATNKGIVWSTSNSNVASVINGRIAGVGVGTAVITVSTLDGLHIATVNVTVRAKTVHAESVVVSVGAIQIAPGDMYSVNATVYPVDATNKAVIWTSSNSAVATVNANGVITAVSEGTATVTVKTVDGGHIARVYVVVKLETCKTSGRVYSSMNGSALSGVTVKAYKNGLLIATVNTNSSGLYTFEALPYGSYNFVYTKSTYLTSNYDVTLSTEAHTVENIQMIIDGELYGKVTGRVTDSVTLAGVSGITVNVREGSNNTTGNVVATFTVNSSGYYTTSDLLNGYYTFEFVDGRGVYASISLNVSVVGNQTVTYNAIMSGGLVSYDSMRIVLKWGRVPSDLDSHLAISNSGNKYHIWYSEKNPYGANANLDVDDTSSYGPETVTVVQMFEKGIYNYYIHDYTNRSSSSNTQLANSDATVEVYFGDSLYQTFTVPVGTGTYWNVFTYNAYTGEFTVINSISNTQPSI